jgi:hypothetical protein
MDRNSLIFMWITFTIDLFDVRPKPPETSVSIGETRVPSLMPPSREIWTASLINLNHLSFHPWTLRFQTLTFRIKFWILFFMRSILRRLLIALRVFMMFRSMLDHRWRFHRMIADLLKHDSLRRWFVSDSFFSVHQSHLFVLGVRLRIVEKWKHHLTFC